VLNFRPKREKLKNTRTEKTKESKAFTESTSCRSVLK